MTRRQLLEGADSHELAAWQAFFRVRRVRDKAQAKRAREEMDDEVIIHDGAFNTGAPDQDDDEDDGETE